MSVLGLLLVAQTGVISGTVRYSGSKPAPEPFAVDVDGRTCGVTAPIVPEDLVVREGRLAYVAVVVSMPPEHTGAPSTVELDQKNCTFEPHVQTVTLGSELIIGNSDPIIHNVHAKVGGETVFNLGMPLQGVSAKRKLDRPGIHEMSCDSGHWWMKAYAIVVPHHFHATTSVEGTFSIEGVPVGKRQIWLWHERFGSREVEVEVKPDVTTTIDLSFDDEPTVSAKEPSFDPAPEPEEGALVESLEVRRVRIRREGRSIYVAQCASCHGVAGDGRGPSARFLSSRPRDFLRGEFKFRTTPSGRAPTFADVYRTISLGVPGTEMPAFRRRLSKEQRELLSEYVLTFSSKKWIDAQRVEPIPIPEPPPSSPEAIERGRALYAKLKCAQCHGADGGKRSDADLTKGYYKGGAGVAVIYRALTTGLSGAAMPSFAHVLGEGERWDLARYVESLGRSGAGKWFLDQDVGRRATP